MITGKQKINVGAENQAANSDSLYVAFNKIENNFVALFQNASPYVNFISGEGMDTSYPTPNSVAFTNTGVLNLIEGTGITLSGSNGNVTISSESIGGAGGAGVTSVGLISNSITITNAPIVSSGFMNIDLPLQGNLVAGEYSFPTVTVDKYGRVTDIATNPTIGTVTSIALASGDGVSVTGSPITSNGTITVTNTGVTRISAGAGIMVTASTGNITISATQQVGGAGSTAGGSESQIQLNIGGQLGGSANLSFDYANGITQATTINSNLIVSTTVTANTVNATKILKLTPVTTEPVSPTAGTFAVADRTNWDPATKGSGNAYPVFYDGGVWHALY
jgi:hypothetical protein